MKRRALVIGSLTAVVAVVVILRDPGARRSASREAKGATSDRTPQAAVSSAGPETLPLAAIWDGGAIGVTVADRQVRDELRRRIVAGWAGSDPHGAAAASEAPMPTMPTGSDGRIDPQYIKDIVRADLRPMIDKCFEELSTRTPGAEGRLSMTFTIVGDDKVGGIVEETALVADAGALASDDAFTTCVRESTMSLAFRPPPADGHVVVPLTIVFPRRPK